MSALPRPTVILCTHNPRTEYITRSLAALTAQTLPASDYDLLVVDNASRDPVASRFDLSWHPSARVIVEPTLGLTHARMRGIAETRTELLVWVDDDNLLAPDYLSLTQTLSRDWPMLGAWGCGHFTPEWETPPPSEFSPYLDYLAVARIQNDRWSNQALDYSTMPAGAGLCCRLAVARHYSASVASDSRRALLGRIGSGLGACEDFDLCLHAIDLGFGTGVFTRLRLTHLMPAARVREDYLLRLVEGHARSAVILMALRDPTFRPPPITWKKRLRDWRLRRSLGVVDRRIHDARRRGEKYAMDALSLPFSTTNPSL